MKKIRVRLIKSPIDCPKRHKATLKAMGLNRIGQVAVLPDNSQVRGMVRQVNYLIEVKDKGAK
ncbi:MAG: 50S ribosomal protein L30 [candidate division WOR-3 bacterium]